MWLGKLTVLDMTPLGWLGCKTSTQTNCISLDFTLNLTWTTFYDYIPVYKISVQYTNLFKRYHTETICVTYGTGRDGRTYGQRWYYMPPIENGGGIKFEIVHSTTYWCVFNIAVHVCIANSIDTDQMPYYAASDLVLHCLQRPICPST